VTKTMIKSGEAAELIQRLITRIQGANQ